MKKEKIEYILVTIVVIIVFGQAANIITTDITCFSSNDPQRQNVSINQTCRYAFDDDPATIWEEGPPQYAFTMLMFTKPQKIKEVWIMPTKEEAKQPKSITIIIDKYNTTLSMHKSGWSVAEMDVTAVQIVLIVGEMFDKSATTVGIAGVQVHDEVTGSGTEAPSKETTVGPVLSYSYQKFPIPINGYCRQNLTFQKAQRCRQPPYFQLSA